jgi:hypothetical protein
VRHAAIPPAVLAACFWGAACTPAASAQPETGASISASFQPNRSGASTAVTLAIEFSGGEEGVPAPLRKAVLELPAGMPLDLRRVAVCPPRQLNRHGASGCPSAALVGRGHGLLQARTGTLTSPEEAIISIFRGPNRGSLPTLEVLGQGETPLDEHVLSTAVVEPDSAPYGSRLTMSVPPIPTLVLEPNASFKSLTVTLGGVGHGPRAHLAGRVISVPDSCPSGGFPFATAFTFTDSSTANASTTVPCPTR